MINPFFRKDKTNQDPDVVDVVIEMDPQSVAGGFAGDPESHSEYVRWDESRRGKRDRRERRSEPEMRC